MEEIEEVCGKSVEERKWKGTKEGMLTKERIKKFKE